MKELFEKGFLYLVIAIFVAVAGVIVFLIAIGLLLTAIGNLAFWPALGSMLIGKPLSPSEALVGGAVLLVAIFLGLQFLPDRTGRFLETFASIWVMGVMASLMILFLGSLICALGLPIIFAADYFLKLKLPIWASFPVGLVVWFLWTRLKPRPNS